MILVGKCEGKRQLARPRCRKESNSRIDFEEMRWESDWIDLVQDRGQWRTAVNLVMELLVT